MHYRSDNHGHKGLPLILFFAQGVLSGLVSDPELNPNYFQGDIVNPPVKRNGIADPIFHWPNAVVQFEIDRSNLENKHVLQIKLAMVVIEANSCVRFQQTRWKHNPRTLIIAGRKGGCASAFLGYRKVNRINLEPSTINEGCFRIGTIIHELLHTLGFEHQHVAHNRDEYVQIVWENIMEGLFINFVNDDHSTQWHSYGEEYDYDSVMHYPSKAFSKNGEVTIVGLREGSHKMGQRARISEIDIRKLNKMYKCLGYA